MDMKEKVHVQENYKTSQNVIKQWNHGLSKEKGGKEKKHRQGKGSSIS